MQWPKEKGAAKVKEGRMEERGKDFRTFRISRDLAKGPGGRWEARAVKEVRTTGCRTIVRRRGLVKGKGGKDQFPGYCKFCGEYGDKLSQCK